MLNFSDHPVNVAARNLAKKELEKKKSSAALKQTWSFDNDEHELSEIKRTGSGLYTFFSSHKLTQTHANTHKHTDKHTDTRNQH